MSENLIVNGDFAQNSLAGWSVFGTANNIVSYQEGAAFNASSLNADGSGIQQIATTVSGTEYVLGFTAREYANGSAEGDHNLLVEVLDGNGNVLSSTTFTILRDTSRTETISFTATDTSTTIRFSNPSSTATFNTDLMLDDITLYDAASVPCFTTGTLIDTDQGPVPVETLQAGDMIRTKDHGFQPVKWVGASRVYASGFDVPLRIKAGTFSNTRDLVVSKRHKMLMDHTHLSLMFDVEEAFACAMHLRNDDTITREPEGWVTYYHVLLPQHEVIYAEGAATESFYPDEGTLAGMATKTKEELLTHFDPKTYGPPARPTLDPTRAMWIGRNLDVLNGNDMDQIAAYEDAVKVAE